MCGGGWPGNAPATPTSLISSSHPLAPLLIHVWHNMLFKICGFPIPPCSPSPVFLSTMDHELLNKPGWVSCPAQERWWGDPERDQNLKRMTHLHNRGSSISARLRCYPFLKRSLATVVRVSDWECVYVMYSSCLGFGECIHAALMDCWNNAGQLKLSAEQLISPRSAESSMDVSQNRCKIWEPVPRDTGRAVKLWNQLHKKSTVAPRWWGVVSTTSDYSHQWQIFQTCHVKRSFVFVLCEYGKARNFPNEEEWRICCPNLGRCLRKFMTKVMSPKLQRCSYKQGS